MEQITIREAMLEIKVNQLNEKIKQLNEENIKLKQIIMWQSYEKSGITTTPKTLVKKPTDKGVNNERKRND